MTRERIRKLRAKAQSSTFEAEAASLSAKATELEQKNAEPKALASVIAAMLRTRGHQVLVRHSLNRENISKHVTTEITYRWGSFVRSPWRPTPPPEIQITVVVNVEAKRKPRP